MYEARANTGIDRMKIINSVAKSVPQPHKVDLSNPDKTIIVQVVKVRIRNLLDQIMPNVYYTYCPSVEFYMENEWFLDFVCAVDYVDFK